MIHGLLPYQKCIISASFAKTGDVELRSRTQDGHFCFPPREVVKGARLVEDHYVVSKERWAAVRQQILLSTCRLEEQFDE